MRKIAGWLSDYEEQLLAYFAKKSPGTIVEIGSFQGKSTVAMGLATRNLIYAIDPHQGQTQANGKKGLPTYTVFLKNIKKYHLDKVVPIRKTSETANKGWKKKISLLHIDGLHEYEFAKQDLKLWLPHLENNGVVICHDAFAPFPEVWRAVREEIFNGKFSYIGVLDSQVFAVKGRGWNYQQPFIILASNIWHSNLPYSVRDFLVKRVLKSFYLNKFILKEIFRRPL
ncbi:class I SAM-dependent methyltransferase [Patescibacteria group bacterium]|nr:class I SAM-dependent methyltransferase [Patescibacteria group bacterium]